MLKKKVNFHNELPIVAVLLAIIVIAVIIFSREKPQLLSDDEVKIFRECVRGVTALKKE